MKTIGTPKLKAGYENGQYYVTLAEGDLYLFQLMELTRSGYKVNFYCKNPIMFKRRSILTESSLSELGLEYI